MAGQRSDRWSGSTRVTRLPYKDVGYSRPLNVGVRIDFADSEIDEAHDALRAARRRAGNGSLYRMPCLKNPLLFDTKNDGEYQRRFDQRTEVAKALCLSSCKVFAECLALSRVDSSIWGVLAGRVVKDPTLEKKGGKKKRAPKSP